MQHREARSVLQSLIEGREPGSALELPLDSVIHRPDVMRALLAAVVALDQAQARSQRRASLPGNVGHPWTADEQDSLVVAFKAGDAPETIARRHGRTLRAIEARLQKLGLITAEQRTTRGGFSAPE